MAWHISCRSSKSCPISDVTTAVLSLRDDTPRTKQKLKQHTEKSRFMTIKYVDILLFFLVKKKESWSVVSTLTVEYQSIP